MAELAALLKVEHRLHALIEVARAARGQDDSGAVERLKDS